MYICTFVHSNAIVFVFVVSLPNLNPLLDMLITHVYGLSVAFFLLIFFFY